MARIRSIHPGLFTDENFMSASIAARMLLIGIWTEAFDDGVFEWKPITLKARIFPVDAVAVPELLTELEGLNFIKKFEVDGKSYGVIRNFCKWQRPKKPNSSGVLPNELMLFAAYSENGSEPVPNQFRTGGEKSPQMEDGGWRGREGGRKKDAAAVAAHSVPPPPSHSEAPDARVYRRGREVLGNSAGGIVKKLIVAKDGNLSLAAAAIETASTKADPKTYLMAIVNARQKDTDTERLRISGDAW